MWTWGSQPAAGRGGFGSDNTPQRVAGFNDVETVSCADHCVVQRRYGSVWGWGNNGGGQRGTGTTSVREALPVKAQGTSLR